MFGDELARLVQARSLSQAELGRLVGVDSARVSRWIRGKEVPGRESLGRICVALGLVELELDTLHIAAGHLPMDIEVGLRRPALLSYVRAALDKSDEWLAHQVGGLGAEGPSAAVREAVAPSASSKGVTESVVAESSGPSGASQLVEKAKQGHRLPHGGSYGGGKGK